MDPASGHTVLNAFRHNILYPASVTIPVLLLFMSVSLNPQIISFSERNFGGCLYLEGFVLLLEPILFHADHRASPLLAGRTA